MFYRIVAVVVQTIFFVLVFATGSFLPGVMPDTFPMWRQALSAGRYFIWNGPVFLFVIFLIFIGIEAAMKRLRTSGLITTIAFVLAFLIALAAKLPFINQSTM